MTAAHRERSGIQNKVNPEKVNVGEAPDWIAQYLQSQSALASRKLMHKKDGKVAIDSKKAKVGVQGTNTVGKVGHRIGRQKTKERQLEG